MRPLACAALGLALALGACSVADLRLPSSASHESAQADELLAYLARLRGMSAASLGAEAARERKAAVAGPAGDLARVKAALALTLAAPADDTEVLGLIEPVLRRPHADAKIAGVANFLQAIAVERRRLRESATAAGARLRDEHRAAEQQRQRADALQDRATELQKKLDALSELEKSLTDRQSPSH